MRAMGMNEEPFVLSSSDRALAWVDVCCRVLGATKEDTAGMLATLCGFGGWDIMMYAIDSLPPSKVDEKLSTFDLDSRLRRHVLTLVNAYDIDPIFAATLVNKISPTSGKPFEPFSLDDHATVRSSVEALKSVFLDIAEGDEELAGVEITPDEFHTFPVPNRFAQVLPLSGDPDPYQWVGIFEYLGWEFELIEEFPDVDQPSFIVRDSILGKVPVYLTTWTGPPPQGDSEIDPTIRLQRSLVAGDFVQNRSKTGKAALLLNRWPQVKVADDSETLCHLGSIYVSQKNEWKCLLFNRHCTSVTELISRNAAVIDIAVGARNLEDVDSEFSNLATIFLSGYDLEEVEGVEFSLAHGTDETTGWCKHKIIIEGEYEA